MVYAVFGALTGMHGRAESHQLRLKHQALAAVLLAGVSVGTFLSVAHVHLWGLVVGEGGRLVWPRPGEPLGVES